MRYNKHSNLEGRHALLSASKHSWLNYDLDKLETYYRNFQASQRGTRLHAFACESIKLGVRLPRTKSTLNQYVNDAIGYKMTPEQVLYYSDNCFGTADALSFNNDLLRIHDLKTGVGPVSMDQLFIYCALYCLEYGVRPGEIKFETRIYQNNDVIIENPEPEDIAEIMDRIIKFDKYINKWKEMDGEY